MRKFFVLMVFIYISMILFTFRLADYIEKNFEDYVKQDPDPLDERPPSKIIEKSLYAETLKTIARDNTFIYHVSFFL